MYRRVINMANTKVTIKVVSKASKLFLVGSTKNLGAWDAKKAVELEYCEKCGAFFTDKLLPAGEVVEFKVLTAKSWDNVEKGAWGEEVANHSFVAEKGLEVVVEVNNFAK
jgi:ribosomal protein L31